MSLTRWSKLRWVMVAGGVVTIDIALWGLCGAGALRREVPGMARAALEISGGHVPYGLEIQDVTVLDDPHGPLPPAEMSELRAVFSKYGLALHSEAEFPPPQRPYDDLGRPTFLAFAYSVRIDTPVFAEVYTQHFLGSGGSSTYRHWRLWCFGLWLPLSDELAGME